MSQKLQILKHIVALSIVISFNLSQLSRHLESQDNNTVYTSPVRLSVTFVHPTQAIEIFGNLSTPFGTLAIY